MDELFAELRQEGRPDSVGSFSLDFSKAYDKLRKFQSQPDQFAVQLVAAATLRGATRIEVRSLQRDFSFDFAAPPYTWPELQSLFQLEQPGADVFRLNMALLACLGLDPTVLWLETADYRMAIRGNQLELMRQPQRRETTRIWMTLPWRQCSLPTPEAQALIRRCSFCPVPISLNGRQLAPPLAPVAKVGLAPAALWPTDESSFVLDGAPEVAYLVNPEPPFDGVQIILHGVRFALPGPDWPPGPKLGALLWSHQAGTDISFLQLREDLHCRSLATRAVECWDELLPDVLARVQLAPELQTEFLEYLAGRSGQQARRARLKLLRWAVRDTPENGLASLSAMAGDLEDDDLRGIWSEACNEWLARLEEEQGRELLGSSQWQRFDRLWGQVDPLPLSDEQRAIVDRNRLRLLLLVWDLERAAPLAGPDEAGLIEWALGFVVSGPARLGSHPLVLLAGGELDRAAEDFAALNLPLWQARCLRLLGRPLNELAACAPQTFHPDWVRAEQLLRPERPSRLRALAPVVGFLKDCRDVRLLTTLALLARQEHGLALEAAAFELSPEMLRERLASGWRLEQNGDLAGAEARYLGLLYQARMTRPAHPATLLLASWVGSFYLEHGAWEEGVRHLLWGELPELLAAQRSLKACQSATA